MLSPIGRRDHYEIHTMRKGACIHEAVWVYHPVSGTAGHWVHEIGIQNSDLRQQGFAIGRRIKTSKNRYGKYVSFAEYYLEEDNNA
jgi:hypothetical protein